eukprot:3818802-Prymnesium_polylepis.1
MIVCGYGFILDTLGFGRGTGCGLRGPVGVAQPLSHCGVSVRIVCVTHTAASATHRSDHQRVGACSPPVSVARAASCIHRRVLMRYHRPAPSPPNLKRPPNSVPPGSPRGMLREVE